MMDESFDIDQCRSSRAKRSNMGDSKFLGSVRIGLLSGCLIRTKDRIKSHPHFNSFRDLFLPTAIFMQLAAGVLLAFFLFSGFSDGCPFNSTLSNSGDDVDDRIFVTMPTAALRPASGCFPGFNFKMPESPPASLTGWWCDWDTEYAFVGFSYEVSACQSFQKLKHEFMDIRQRFHGRYVRIYGACDRKGFNDDVINAAWHAGIGVHALIWFGFDGDNKWKSRRDALFLTLHSNPYAKFVVRVVQFGSEPLFDGVLSSSSLAKQVWSAKSNLAKLQIPVTVSDLAYSYQKDRASSHVIDAIDIIDAHILPFFSRDASTAKKSWPIVQKDINWFLNNGQGKKIYLSQNGWPSKSYPGVEPNSDKAVANVKNEKDYFNLLDAHCSYFKSAPGGGIGWFAHIYSDVQEPGYGIYDTRGKLKFPFSPRVTC